MKKILSALLIVGLLSGMAGARTLSEAINNMDPVSIKKVDAGGVWGYIITRPGGQKQYVEYAQLQKRVEALDKEIAEKTADRAAIIKLMERCVNAK